MQIGIIGLPFSGKTTVFNALTGSNQPVGQYHGAEVAPNIAVVKVPDPRLHVLAGIFHPRRVVQADVTYLDLAGVGLSRERGVSSQLATYLVKCDALLHVARAFEDPNFPHVEETIDPARDVAAIELELAFFDLSLIEKRLARLDEMAKKGKAEDKEAAAREGPLLIRLRESLEREVPIRALDLTDEEWKVIRHYQFLTGKPLVHVVNVGEEQVGDTRLVAQLRERFPWPNTGVAHLAGKVEMEIAQLPEEDIPEFLASLGIAEPARDRVIRLCYELLGLIAFLTGGPDEVRAWPIVRGTMAQKAAGVVHSDIERGFIRAEVVAYADLVRTGSMAEAKRHGLVRLEGKQYVVQDGDVCNFLFNV
ncbi:MAG: redox-regulated ATPase YchF [Chloroflexi bacterium]|nr:redox-regulated ATPase YchF [Chloroflexota bacterium]